VGSKVNILNQSFPKGNGSEMQINEEFGATKNVNEMKKDIFELPDPETMMFDLEGVNIREADFKDYFKSYLE